ncbi:MAG: hypothetical protein H7A33_00165 [Deltaproteobacteria bacterium]|nr:hypothetical protein [Deltaproteobacteria bacterium]
MANVLKLPPEGKIELSGSVPLCCQDKDDRETTAQIKGEIKVTDDIPDFSFSAGAAINQTFPRSTVDEVVISEAENQLVIRQPNGFLGLKDPFRFFAETGYAGKKYHEIGLRLDVEPKVVLEEPENIEEGSKAKRNIETKIDAGIAYQLYPHSEDKKLGATFLIEDIQQAVDGDPVMSLEFVAEEFRVFSSDSVNLDLNGTLKLLAPAFGATAYGDKSFFNGGLKNTDREFFMEGGVSFKNIALPHDNELAIGLSAQHTQAFKAGDAQARIDVFSRTTSASMSLEAYGATVEGGYENSTSLTEETAKNIGEEAGLIVHDANAVRKSEEAIILSAEYAFEMKRLKKKEEEDKSGVLGFLKEPAFVPSLSYRHPWGSEQTDYLFEDGNNAPQKAETAETPDILTLTVKLKAKF